MVWQQGGERTDTELHLLQLIDPGPTPAKLTFAEATKTFAARNAEHCHSYDWFLLWSAQTGKRIILKNLLFL